MPEARKTPESRRFAGLGHDRAAVVAGRNERLRENSPIDDGSMGYGCADTAGMGVEFPILRIQLRPRSERPKRPIHPSRPAVAARKAAPLGATQIRTGRPRQKARPLRQN